MTENTETIQLTADVVCVRGSELLTVVRGWPPFKGGLALPGGYVDPGEEPLDAAVRELWEETRVRVDAKDLVPVGRYGRPGRDPRGRFVTEAYLVLVDEKTTAEAWDDAAEVHWVPFDAPGDLAFDHTEIVRAAWTLRQTMTD